MNKYRLQLMFKLDIIIIKYNMHTYYFLAMGRFRYKLNILRMTIAPTIATTFDIWFPQC